MASKYCRKCHHEMPLDAVSCPGCDWRHVPYAQEWPDALLYTLGGMLLLGLCCAIDAPYRADMVSAPAQASVAKTASAQEQETCAVIRTLDDWMKRGDWFREAYPQCVPIRDSKSILAMSPQRLWNALEKGGDYAQRKFFGEQVAVRGLVHSAGITALGDPEIAFSVFGDERAVRCEIDGSGAIPDISPGDELILMGVVRSFNPDDSVVLANCMIFDKDGKAKQP